MAFGLIICDLQLINSLRSYSITLSTNHSVMVAIRLFSIFLIALNLSAILSLSTDAQVNGENDFTVTVKTVNTHETGKVTLTVTNNGSESGLNITLTDTDTDLSRTVEKKLSLPFNIGQLDDQIALSWTSAAKRVSRLDSIGIVEISFSSKDSTGKEVTKSFRGSCYAHVWKRTLFTTKCCCHEQ